MRRLTPASYGSLDLERARCENMQPATQRAEYRFYTLLTCRIRRGIQVNRNSGSDLRHPLKQLQQHRRQLLCATKVLLDWQQWQHERRHLLQMK